MIRPTALRPGARVALVAPAGPVAEGRIDVAVERCRSLGFEPRVGPHAADRTGYLAGRDADRAADLERALRDADAVWALRGGYGTLRTLTRIDPGSLLDRPVPFIGFSDNTAIHLALLRRGLISFHGPHAGSEHFPPSTREAFGRVLGTPRPAGVLPVPPGTTPRTVVGGVAEGRLVGGNLALLAATCGTAYQADTRGAILFLEDIGEPLYKVDRMLMQLRLAGLLDGLAGVAIGEFMEMEDPLLDHPPGDATSADRSGDPAAAPAAAAAPTPSLEGLVRELLGPLGVPVVLGLPFGHGTENWTLPLGVAARLDATAGSLELLEPAVRAGGGTT